MDSVINKLTEIEQTASAIVAHAEAEKEKLDREYEEKRKVFDLRMEEETKARIEKIQEGLEHDKENLLTGPIPPVSARPCAYTRRRSMIPAKRKI